MARRAHEARAEAAFRPSARFWTWTAAGPCGGDGHGPDLVLIHGASGNLRDFTFDLAARLADRYRVIVFDRPGLGYTDRHAPAGADASRQQADLLLQAADSWASTTRSSGPFLWRRRGTGMGGASPR